SSRQPCDQCGITGRWHHRAMMTQQLEVSILAAPLAAIDRRALSQAWYSALHLATPDRRAVPLRESSPCPVATSTEVAPKRESESLSRRRTETHVAHSERTNAA